MMSVHESNKEIATLGGGCFWCLEAVYDDLIGVESVVSGYAGGHVVNPTYEQICAKTTGHAEVVQVTFDPTVITFREILEVFFTIHDPTTPNRQRNDVGPQYRSAIFYHDGAQRETAETIITEFNAAGIWPNPIVTELAPFDMFYTAEKYHQNYFSNNPNQPYCQYIVAPKVAKFRKKFSHRRKSRTG